nr:hypothetical protein [Tanacetum cinerariifolium]
EFVSKNSNADIESFSPSSIPVEDSDSLMEEIDLSFTPDDPMPRVVPENYDPKGERFLIASRFPTPLLAYNITSELPPCAAITPNEPVDSLSMGDEHLDTVLAMKSDEFIKSCVENLVPNPSESEGENGCDVPVCFTTFSNILFDADYDFDFGDDQTFFEEDFPKKIYSNPFFDEEIIPMKIDPHPFNAESDLIESMPNHDSSIFISLKFDSLFDEFAGELTLLKSIPPGINETNCHLEEETHFTKRLFDSRMEEIDLTFTPDDPMPPGINEDDCDSERDIPIFKELLDNYSLSLPENESYHFDIPSPSRPPAKPPDGNTRILNIKMMGDISDQKVPIHNLMITRVSSQEKSPDLLPHQCQPKNHDYYHEQNFCYDSNSFGFDHGQPPRYTFNHPIFNAHNDLFSSRTTLMEQMTQLTSMCEMFCQIVQKKQEEKRIEEEQSAKGQNWKLPVCYDDDDDEERSNSLQDNIISGLPPCSAITPNEPVDSLSLGDEHLDTIPATESDEFIKFGVENLVPNPSESKGESVCDMPAYEAFTTFSNVLFDADYDFYSVDDQSLSDEDLQRKSIRTLFLTKKSFL